MGEVYIDQDEQLRYVSQGLILGPLALREFLRSEDRGKYRSVNLDMITGRVVVGSVGIKAHKSLGGSMKELRPLRDLLRDPDLDASGYTYKQEDYDVLDNDDYILYGKWLSSVVGPSGDARALTFDILQRAHQLGVGPGTHRIEAGIRFGTVTNYQEKIGLKNIRWRHAFDEWTQQDCLKHLKKIGQQLKRRPTERDLLNRIRKGKKEPSPFIIGQKFKGRGIASIAERATGYVNVKSWDNEDFINWGKKFMRANQGVIPTSRALDFLVNRGYGPSQSSIKRRFDGILKYQAILNKEYEEEVAKIEIDRKDKLEKIRAIAESDSRAAALFEDGAEEETLLIRYARYEVVNDLLGPNQTDSKLSISLSGTKTLPAKNLVGQIRKVNDAFTAGDIEYSALTHGVFDYLWPMDDYMTTLKIPDELLAKAA